MREHSKDSDCTLDPHGVCTVCSVWHGSDCPYCGARGYHATDCAAEVYRLASREFTRVTADYRARRIGDEAFLAAHRVHAEALAAAEAAERALTREEEQARGEEFAANPWGLLSDIDTDESPSAPDRHALGDPFSQS